jgi:hypothetical protein
MRYTLSDKLIAYLALLSGLSISAVAIYYSVAGLMAIFAAAVIPIMIMGIVLEIGKLSATVWLKQNWVRAPLFLKTYLLIAILALMLLTSMGIFGYLSKAHLDQAVPTGDVADKVALIDEKIKTQRDNIDAAKRALTQMDSQVDQMLGRTDTDRGAERAVQIRRNQAKERNQLQAEIAKAQAEIAKLNEERSPIAKELRKVEAEVGPIKYIAALIYGDQTDQNLLEKAVRWVIIVIVLVFDPLAVILLLASQYSFNWFRKQDTETPELIEPTPVETKTDEQEDETLFVEPSPTPGTLWPFPAVMKQEQNEDEKSKDNIDNESEIENLNVDDQVEKPAEEIVNDLTEVDQNTKSDSEINNTDSLGEKSKLDEWNEMLAEAEKAAELENEVEEAKLIEEAPNTEKEAMRLWKTENPGGTWKQQRKLLDRGVIDQLPWTEFVKVKPDYIDEAAIEAKKWAEENPQTEEAEKAKEWAKERGVYIGLDQPSDISWMEHDENGNQIKKTKEAYQQNAEQNERTIWQRIQDAKK